MDGSIATLPNRLQELDTILASVSKLQKQIEPTTTSIQKKLEPIVAPMLEIQKQLEPLMLPMKKIFAQYPVRRAALFGSSARQDMNELSDIDILIELVPGSSELDFYGLGIDLEEALGCRVNLLT